jgi:hypothetical protein
MTQSEFYDTLIERIEDLTGNLGLLAEQLEETNKQLTELAMNNYEQKNAICSINSNIYAMHETLEERL